MSEERLNAKEFIQKLIDDLYLDRTEDSVRDTLIKLLERMLEDECELEQFLNERLSQCKN